MMIRFSCTQCGKTLSADESKAGKTGRCPACKETFRIPDADPPAEEAIRSAPAAPRRPPPVQAPGEDEEAPDREADDEQDQDEDRDDRPRRKKRRKKRRRSSSGSGSGFDMQKMLFFGALAAGAIGVISVILAFIVPPLAVIPMGLGSLLSMAGGAWFLVVAFMDDITQGVLCLCVPCYSLYYLITNFESTKLPFLVNVIGVLVSVGGQIAMGRMQQ